LTNQPGAESWPITAATFIMIYQKPEDKVASASALKFFDWAYAKGGDMAKELTFIPMPENVITQVRTMWQTNLKTNKSVMDIPKEKGGLTTAFFIEYKRKI